MATKVSERQMGNHKKLEEDDEEKWVNHYSLNHQMLLVGEGDFSFSLSLALSFGSASNILASSLDSYGTVTKKYKDAKSNLDKLKELGASILHGIDATKMELHPDLQMRKFDRILFNFPHAGFHGKEDNPHLIKMHRNLVHGFFKNASSMLRANGEIHVNHKTTAPFCHWNLPELAFLNSLALIECVDFKMEDYPGYNNKRGAGSRCDEPFPLGDCSTFIFKFSPSIKKMSRATNTSRLIFTQRSQRLPESPIQVQRQPALFDVRHRQIQIPILQQTISINTRDPQTPMQMHQRPHSLELRHPRNPGQIREQQNSFNTGHPQITMQMHQQISSIDTRDPLISIHMQRHPTLFDSRVSQKNFNLNMNDFPRYVGSSLSVITTMERPRIVNGRSSHVSEILHFGPEAQRYDFKRCMSEAPGRTSTAYMCYKEELQRQRIQRSAAQHRLSLCHDL